MKQVHLGGGILNPVECIAGWYVPSYVIEKYPEMSSWTNIIGREEHSAPSSYSPALHHSICPQALFANQSDPFESISGPGEFIATPDGCSNGLTSHITIVC